MATLDGLNPHVKAKAEQLLEIANCKLTNYKMIITQALRTNEDQAKLYGQGRRSYVYKGKQYGNPSKPKVTNAKPGSSMHNFGLAIDFALKSPDGKKVVWDTKTDFDKDGKADWMEVVVEAKKLGFEWGGDWTSFKDYPHFEMTGGLSLSQLRAGKRPVFATQAASAPTSTAKPPYPTIDEDTTGTVNIKYIKKIQTAVGVTADGIFGPNTKKAVIAYQKKHGLVADGIVGAKTWEKILA